MGADGSWTMNGDCLALGLSCTNQAQVIYVNGLCMDFGYIPASKNHVTFYIN